MKKFLVRFFVFCALVIAIDQIGGRALLAMYAKAKKDYPEKFRHVIYEGEEDVMIYGSSRAFRHYNPTIISEETGLTAFNAGNQGNGALFAYGLYLASRKHHIPKVAIIDIYYEYDLMPLHANTRFIDLLKPYYGDYPDLQEYFKRIDPWTSLTMNSMLYRTNSQLFTILKSQRGESNFNKGFEPLPVPPQTVDENLTIPNLDFTTDSSKIHIIEDMIELMKKDGVQVVLTFSPVWHDFKHFPFRDTIATIAQKHQVEYWDFTTNEGLTAKDFHDLGHLNSEGADRFSRMVGQRLKAVLHQ